MCIRDRPTADLLVRTSSLHGTTVGGEIIPTLIDEIPMIAVMAAFAEGTTVIKDAKELKVKESDRILVMAENLSRMGADITPTDDGMIIHGGKPLHGTEIDSYLDPCQILYEKEHFLYYGSHGRTLRFHTQPFRLFSFRGENDSPRRKICLLYTSRCV